MDPHRDGENGSGTDQGNIKSSQDKGDRIFFLTVFYYIYNNLFKKRKNKLEKNLKGGLKLTEIVYHELDPDPFFPNGSVSTDADPRIWIHNTEKREEEYKE